MQGPWLSSWGRPTPTLIPWRQGFRLQQGTSVGVGLPKPDFPLSYKKKYQSQEESMKISTTFNMIGCMLIPIL